MITPWWNKVNVKIYAAKDVLLTICDWIICYILVFCGII